MTSTAGSCHLPSSSSDARSDRSQPGAISTGRRSPDENGNSRVAKPVAIGRSGPGQTIVRPSHSAGRTRPIRDPCELRWPDAIGRQSPTSEYPSVRVRARGEIGCKLVRRRQRSPHEAKGERNHNVGEVRTLETSPDAAGQDQTRHRSSPAIRKTKRAPRTSATQRPQRPPVETSDSITPPQPPARRRRRRARGSRPGSARRSGRSSGGSRPRSSRSCRGWL